MNHLFLSIQTTQTMLNQKKNKVSEKDFLESLKDWATSIMSGDLSARIEILKNSHNKDIAEKNLKLLSGRRHTIFTGLTIIDKTNNKFFYLTKTKIKFKVLNDIEIFMMDIEVDITKAKNKLNKIFRKK